MFGLSVLEYSRSKKYTDLLMKSSYSKNTYVCHNFYLLYTLVLNRRQHFELISYVSKYLKLLLNYSKRPFSVIMWSTHVTTRITRLWNEKIIWHLSTVEQLIHFYVFFWYTIFALSFFQQKFHWCCFWKSLYKAMLELNDWMIKCYCHQYRTLT